ncbi:MAG: hypothetical protein KAY46_05510 [Burkholderiaceae bacterium]|nr:hypothetical protein [Burkholderiaceae bacterium]
MEDVIEFRDPEINAEQVMARIRERIAARRALAASRGLDYDSLAKGHELVLTPAARAAPARNNSALLLTAGQDVARTRQNADSISVPVSLIGYGLPGDSLLRKVRTVFHRLAVYYTNLLAGKQAAVNRSHADALASLLAALEEAHRRIDVLQSDLDRLRGDLENKREP